MAPIKPIQHGSYFKGHFKELNDISPLGKNTWADVYRKLMLLASNLLSCVLSSVNPLNMRL